MNQVVVFYNPFLPELKVSVNGRPLSSYSAIMRYRHSRAGVWCTDLFTELYREANGPFHMTCVSTPFVCGWMEQIAEKAEHCQGFSAKELPLCESVYERLARLELLGYEDGEEIAVPVWNASGDRAMVSAAFEIVEELLSLPSLKRFAISGKSAWYLTEDQWGQLEEKYGDRVVMIRE